jgi:hypothetical protein
MPSRASQNKKHTDELLLENQRQQKLIAEQNVSLSYNSEVVAPGRKRILKALS